MCILVHGVNFLQFLHDVKVGFFEFFNIIYAAESAFGKCKFQPLLYMFSTLFTATFYTFLTLSLLHAADHSLFLVVLSTSWYRNDLVTNYFVYYSNCTQGPLAII